MTIALVANTGSGGTANTVTSSAINTTGANLIVVIVSWYSVADPTLTDSASNSPTARTTYRNNSGGDSKVKMWYYVSPTTSASHTFTAAATSAYPAICVAAFSGADTASAYDKESGAAAWSPGSVTPTNDNALCVAGLTYANTSNLPSVDASMTITDRVEWHNGVHMGGGAAYKVQTTKAAINPTWSATSGSVPATNIAVFNAAAAASSIASRLVRGGLIRGGGLIGGKLVPHGRVVVAFRDLWLPWKRAEGGLTGVA